MNLLVKENLEIIKNLETSLSVKISSPKIKDNIFIFFNQVKKVLAQINRETGDAEIVVNKQVVNGNLSDEFRENILALLAGVPEERLSQVMKKLPGGFANSMNKLVSHLGDDSWLQKPQPLVENEKKDSSDSHSLSGLSLALEKGSDSCKSEHSNKEEKSSPPVPSLSSAITPEPPALPSSSTPSSVPKSGKEKELGYPMEYHALSGTTTLGQILEPLFNLVFISTITAANHCKKSTGVSLNKVFVSKLGVKEEGNTLLYKVLSDKIIEKIFHDDRIIALLNQSINIALLKVVIATTLYRLERRPAKFKTLGGVAYFMAVEEDMLGSSLINDFLCHSAGTADGARGMFRSGSDEWHGLLERIEGDSQLAKRIISGLPDKPSLVTKYWPQKFSALVILKTSMTVEEMKNTFPRRRLDQIKQVLQQMKQ